MQIKCGNSGISSVIIANVPLFIDQLKCLWYRTKLAKGVGREMIHLSRELSLKSSGKAYQANFLGLWHFICVCFFWQCHTDNDRWSCALDFNFMAEIENEKRAENEIENKFSIDNKGKSTQTGINFRLFRANFDTRNWINA